MKDTLLKNGTVITYDEHTSSLKVLSPADVLIRNGRIASIHDHAGGANGHAGKATEQDVEVVDCTDLIISPGFVDTHFHAWQTALRTAAPDETLATYFVKFSQMSPRASNWTPDDIYYSSLEGYLDGINAGVTSYLEHAHANWSTDVIKPSFDGARDSGARIWWGYDAVQRDGHTFKSQYDIVKKLLLSISDDSLIQPTLSIDGFENRSDQDINDVKRLVTEAKIEALTAHCLGGIWPSGKEYPQIAEHRGLQDLNIPIVLSHAGFATKEEIATLKAQNNFISITAQSEFHFGHGQPSTIADLSQIHAISSLGCDTSKAFSHDIVLEARMWLARVRSHQYEATLAAGKIPKYTPMTVNEAFLLATRNGGRALRRDDVGVIKVGAVADLVFFDGTSPNMLGWSDAVAAVLLHSNPGNIMHVMIGGEFRKRDGKLVLKDGVGSWKDVKMKFLESAERLHEVYRQPMPMEGKPLFGWTDREWAEKKQVSAGK